MQQENEKPDFVTENPDGSVNVTLKDGSIITMREPLVEDQLATKGSPEQREVAMIGNLCGLAPDELHKMKSGNYSRLQKALAGFFA